jgi:hypothetical protein
MPSIQETAYPRLKSNLTAKELLAIYTPTAEELALARRATKGRIPQLEFLVLLKTFQRLGYAVPTASLPAGILRQVAATAQRSVSSQELAGYDASGTRKRHLAIIRDYLGLRAYSQSTHQVMAQAMATAALTKHDIVDLINIAIEELVRQRQRQPDAVQIHRRHFEICVFSHIWLELKSGDLYIEASWEYGDYYRQLISWEEYQAGVAEYGRQVNLPIDAGEFIAQLKQWLVSIAQATDQSFPANTEVNYIKDRLVIRRPKQLTPKGLTQLETWISERITPIHLLDALTDTELWLN